MIANQVSLMNTLQYSEGESCQLILNYENPRDIVPVAVNTMKKDIYLKEG